MKADKSSSEKRHLWDNPKNVQRLLVVFFICCALLLLADLFVHRHPAFEHDELDLEQAFGFHGIYGFVACVVLVLLAKQLRKLVMRPEDYYDGESK